MPHWDWNINVGNLVSVLLLVGGVTKGILSLISRVKDVLLTIKTVEANLHAFVKETNEDLRDLRSEIKELNHRSR